jgi:hypothetical protein
LELLEHLELHKPALKRRLSCKLVLGNQGVALGDPEAPDPKMTLDICCRLGYENFAWHVRELNANR